MWTIISIIGVILFLWVAYRQSKNTTNKEKEDRFHQINDGLDMKMRCNPGITDDKD